MAEIRKEPIESYYDVGEELGRGRFAVVRKCTSIKSGEVFAGKFVRKARQGRSAREQLLLEIDILHTSRHPKMVRLYDVFETRTEMVLVIEYAPGGDLHRHCLEQVETVRTEKEICYLIRQIVEAVRYLHENNVVHLDLKPENILLKSDSRFPEIRLIDFGLSRRLDVPYSQFDIVGTPEYVAPEVLAYEPLDVNADMWSIGVVTYVLLSGISPFAGDDVMETYANIGQVEYDFEAEEFDDISDEAKDFIENLLIRQQKKRMSSREALEHPWLKQLEDGIKPEDIADAIKAESIIPTDVLAKAAELNPVQEDTVSDAESEDFLSRDSVSSPEEESLQEEQNSKEENLKEAEPHKEVTEGSELTGGNGANEDIFSSHDDKFERSDSETGLITQAKKMKAQGKTEVARSHRKEEDQAQATVEQNSVEDKSEIAASNKKTEKKVDSAASAKEQGGNANVTLPDKVPEKKAEPSIQSKDMKREIYSNAPDKVPEKKIEPAVPDKVREKKIEPAVPDKVREKKIEPVPDKVPEKKIEPAVPDKVPEKKVESAVLDKVPEKKIESVVEDKVPEKKIESIVQDKVPEEKLEPAVPDNVPEKKIWSAVPDKARERKSESTVPDKVQGKKKEHIFPNKVSEDKAGFVRSHSEPENKTGTSKTCHPPKDESKEHYVRLDAVVVTQTQPAPKVSDEKPTVGLEDQTKTEPLKDNVEQESNDKTVLPVPVSHDVLQDDKVLPDTTSTSPTSKEARTASFALYDTLFSGLETEEPKNSTTSSVSDESQMSDATVERKKSSAIDIDAIIGVSNSPQQALPAQVNKEGEPSPVKKSFNIDSIIGLHTTHKGAVSLATDQQGRGNQLSKEKALQKQSSLDSQPPHKEKSSKIKATASIFDKEKHEKSEELQSKPDSKPERSNGSWKSPTNRSMRYSLEMHDPKPKMVLEKSKSADGQEEGKKLESRHGPASVNSSKVGSGDASHTSRPASLGPGAKLQVQANTNRTPSPCDDVKAVRHGIAAQMASKFSGFETNVSKDQGKASGPLKEKEAVVGKVSQRIHELSSSTSRKEISSPPSSRSSSERSTPERTLLDRKTPERSKSERGSGERALVDRKTPERSSSDKSSSGRSTPERKVLDRSLHSHSSSERSTPERGSPERSASPVDSARRGNSRSRESSQPMKVSDRVKRAEVMFKKEGSSPTSSSPKQGFTLGKGAPMKLVVGESFKVDFSPTGGVQLGSKVTPKESTGSEESPVKGERTSSIRSKFEENSQGSPVKPKKGAVPTPLENVNGASEDTETKPRSKTDTEALRKAAEMIRNSGECETGRRRQPSMAELRGKNPSQRGEKGSPSSPRKSYRRLYVTHVKGSKSLEVVEGALSDVAEVKQKVDEDGLQVQLVMKLPTL